MERPTLHERLLTNVSADETTSVVLGPGRVSRIREVTMYVTTVGAVTSGQVLLETAADPAFTGTWVVLATINPAATDTAYRASVTGVWLALRARVNTAIGGGTVHVDIVGN
mgnify:CR=1 FL=1